MKWLRVLSIGVMFLFPLSVKAEQNYIVPPLVKIPAGKFIMGSNAGGGYKVSHSPAHEVKVNSFQLSQYEVTVKEFRKFVEATQHKTKTECWRRKVGTRDIEMAAGSWDSPKNAPSDFHPVMCIAADDALAYIAWLSKKTGKKYRLPTEAEWEYAARAGSKANYFFGNNEKELCQYANVLDKSGKRAFERDIGLDWAGVDCDDQAEYTSVVGMYKPNAFGLFDMIGNLGEFVEDCEHLNYAGAPTDGSAWTTECHQQIFLFGMIRFDQKIIHRGGSYGLAGTGNRMFERGHAGKSNPSSLGEGFRLAHDDVREGAPAPLADLENTNLFLKELFIAQKKSRFP